MCFVTVLSPHSNSNLSRQRVDVFFLNYMWFYTYSKIKSARIGNATPLKALPVPRIGADLHGKPVEKPIELLQGIPYENTAAPGEPNDGKSFKKMIANKKESTVTIKSRTIANVVFHC